MADKKDLVVKMTINSTDFEAGLKNAKSGMNKFVKETETASGMFRSAMSKMVSAFSALGVAMAAKNLFKDVINSTEEMHDNWTNNINAMKDSWSAFLFQINNGNFQGLKDIIDYAKQARQALDSLGDSAALFNLDLGENQAKMTELLSTIQKKKKSGQDYSAEVDQYNQLLQQLRNDAAMSSKISYDALTGLFGKHGVVLGDYGLTPREAARQGRLAASGQYADVEALKKAMNTAPDLDNVSDFDISTGQSPVQRLREEWGKERFNRAMLLRTLGNITTEEKEGIEKILQETSARDRTIAQMEKQLNRYLTAEDGGGGGGGAVITESQAKMTGEQIAEFTRLSLQEQMLQDDRMRETALIDIEIPNEEIIEEDTDRLVEAIIHAKEEMALLGQNTEMALSAASSLGMAFQSMGKISDSTLGKIFSMLGSVISQIVQTITAMSTLLSVEAAEGTAEVFANEPGELAAKLGAAAAAAAGIAAIIATVKSTMAGSFAEGGIVPGTSYTGDRLWARVNSGEMILNQTQQAALFGGGGGQVRFVIEGSQLKGVLDNYETIQNL